MSEQFEDVGKRLPGLLFSLSMNLENIRELHGQIAATGDGEYIPRTVVVYNEPVAQAKERLGDMVEHLGFLRQEAELIRLAYRETLEAQYPAMTAEELDARSSLGCTPFLQEVAKAEEHYSQLAKAHTPQTKDVSGISVKQATPKKERERGGS